MKMRFFSNHVTLVRGPVLSSVSRPNANPNALPPLGLAYLGGALRSAGYDVTCVDGAGEALDRFRKCTLEPSLFENGLSIEEIVARIPANTSVIGVSCMFSYEWFFMIELIRAIRAKFPEPFIVLGGEHVTAEYDYILRTTPEADACILGEGENKLLGLLEALKNGAPKQELPGIALFDSSAGTVRKNPERDGQYRILDVDSIPRPAWSLLPIEEYLARGGYGSIKSRAIPMLASRGCPHGCTFCSSPQMWTRRWKARDVDAVIEEIKTYKREYGINRVEFYDLTAIIDKKWILEFCHKLIDQNVGITWSMPSGTRTEALSPDVLEAILKSGCNKLSYPFESGNPEVNKLINKKINYERSLASMRSAVKAGIIVKAHLIIGFPWQTHRDVFKEILFAIRLAWIGCYDTMFYNFHPYPGSELHAQLVREGKIVRDETYPATMRLATKATFKDCLSWAPAISGPNLFRLCIFGFFTANAFQFLFRPHRLAKAVYRVLRGRQPLTMPEMMLAAIWARASRQFRARQLVPG